MLTKIHTTTIAVAVAVTLSAITFPALSSAATVVAKPIPTHVSTIVVKAPVAAVKSAGSAGVPGYGDAECESLLSDLNTAEKQSEENLVNDAPSNQAGQLVVQISNQLTSNCMTID